MFRTSIRFTRTALVLAAIAALLVVLGGCGKSEDTSGAAPMGQSGAETKIAATGPAVTVKLKFDQLALESAPVTIKSKSGPSYVQFTYQDNQGNICKCKMPEAMTKGEYLPDEWVRTFNLYKVQEVVKKKVGTGKTVGSQVSDFPFIAPRSTSAGQPASAQQGEPQPQQSTVAPPSNTTPGRRGDFD